jgi:hypothetical protein
MKKYLINFVKKHKRLSEIIIFILLAIIYLSIILTLSIFGIEINTNWIRFTISFICGMVLMSLSISIVDKISKQ